MTLACTIKLLFTAYLMILAKAKAKAKAKLASVRIVNYDKIRCKLKLTFMIVNYNREAQSTGLIVIKLLS
jgi:hypothetical protein